MRITPHFTLGQLTASRTASRLGLDNRPGPEAMDHLVHVLAPGLQRVRDLIGVPLIVQSGYRAPALNRAVRGSPTSAHMQGLAADVVAPALGEPLLLAQRIAPHLAELGLDQLILEPTWVHLGWPPATRQARRQVLTFAAGRGFVAGLPGLRSA